MIMVKHLRHLISGVGLVLRGRAEAVGRQLGARLPESTSRC